MVFYQILYEDEYDLITGHSYYEILEQSTVESRIFELYNALKNKKEYPNILLEKTTDSHTTYWDDNKQNWL